MIRFWFAFPATSDNMFLMILSQKDYFGGKHMWMWGEFQYRKAFNLSLLRWTWKVLEAKSNWIANTFRISFSLVFCLFVCFTRIWFSYYLILFLSLFCFYQNLVLILSHTFFVFVRMHAWSCNIKQHLANNARHAKN